MIYEDFSEDKPINTIWTWMDSEDGYVFGEHTLNNAIAGE